MAIVGSLIVFSGLVVLSFVISKLHTIAGFLEKKKPPSKIQDDQEKDLKDIDLSGEWPSDIREQAKLYQPIIDNLGPSFELQELYLIAEEYGVPHPHLTITEFRYAGFLVSLDEGFFSWNFN